MGTKKTIRRIVVVAIWLAIGTGMLMLLIAAIGRQKKETCKDYVISISGAADQELFLQKNDVVALLKAAAKGKIKGQPIAALDLWKMEQLLEDNQWVKDAQLYIDNKEVLHVKVQERTPVARVFTSTGQSFYFDENGQKLPLSERMNTRLPVFTGYTDKKKMTAADSILLSDIVHTATYINTQPFWAAQVSQIDIVPAGPRSWEMDMVPLIGSHIVKLGDGKNIEQKFNRLFTFYKEVLSKSGFGKYKTVDVRFAGQVVAARSENPKVDQAQLKRNVDALLRQIKEAEKAAEADAAEQQRTVTAAPADNAARPAATARQADDKPADNGNRQPRNVMPPRRDQPKPKTNNN